VDISPEVERRRLRNERDRLNAQIARLIAEDSLITDLDNPLLRQEHYDRLERHHREYRAFRADLARFHQLYGVLGE
jgi:hypothetical protein